MAEFSKQLERLEAIVRRLESEDLDLDEALKLFEEGVERLRVAREQVAQAARVLARGLATLELSTERRREIALELFRAAGAGGMIGGQTLDLEAEAKALLVEALAEVHRRKTGALIAASCVIGGLAANGTRGHVEALRAYGEAIGLAFQIADDVLDATATSDQLGKTAGKDA